MSSIYDVLRKVGKHEDYKEWHFQNIRPGITRHEFLAIMMDESSEPCYHTIRSVNEKWNLLLDLGFGKLRNGDFMIFDLGKIRAALNVELWDDENDHANMEN